MMRVGVFLLVACGLTAACGETRSAEPAPQAPALSGVVDSIFPVEEEIRRFKANLPASLQRDSLVNGATTRDSLVQAFVTALERNDTSALRAMVLDPGEFIDLYYPVSPYARPPYKQSPAFVWFLFQENGNKGISRALRRYGGRPSGFQGYSCDQEHEVRGENRLWQNCTISWGLEPRHLRLFGTIMERAGRLKFVSYANDL